jgi:Tfp pilus assembly protein PilO
MQVQLSKIFAKVNKEKYGKYLDLIPDFKKEKAQKFTTIVLTIISVIILAIFAINPTLSTIANLQKQLDDAKFVTDKLQQKINNLSILQSKYNSIQADLPVIYESIPKSSQVPMLTGQIQTLAEDSNLDLVNIKSTEITKSPNNYYFYTFSTSAKGNYNDILVFLNKVISMQRITDISNVSIVQGPKEESPLELSLKGLVFFKE